MHYAYLIESTLTPTHHYVGLTSDVKQRLADHNAGKSAHSSKFKPWRLVTYAAFSDRAKAASFERDLKSGSGHAWNVRCDESGQTAPVPNITICRHPARRNA